MPQALLTAQAILQGRAGDLEAQRRSLEGHLAAAKRHSEEHVQSQQKVQRIQMDELRQQVGA